MGLWRARASAKTQAVIEGPKSEGPKMPSVWDGKLLRTSVSAMQKYLECPSKWYFRYVLGLPDDPPGKAQKRGTEGHRRIEKYLGTGLDILDKLERTGLRFMPPPNIVNGVHHPVPLLLEEPLGGLMFAQGVPMTGSLDMVNPRTLDVDGVLRITDWKFKKALEYASKDEHLIDPSKEAGQQMLGYGFWGKLRFPQASQVELRHVTFQREGPADSCESGTTVSLDKLSAGWETVTEAAIPGMQQAARAKSHLDVRKNESVCQKFRKPCPYIGTCLDKTSRIASGFRRLSQRNVVLEAPAAGETTMGMLSKITAPQAAAPVPTSQPIQPESTQPKPSRLAAQEEPSNAIQAEKAETGKDYVVNGAVARFLCPAPINDQKFMSFMPLTGGVPVMLAPNAWITPVAAALPLVKPPDAPKSDPALAARVDTLPAAKTPEQVQDETRQAMASMEKKEKPPRAKKEKASPAPTPAAPAAASSGFQLEKTMMGSMEGVYLYRGCTPLGVHLTSLSIYASRLEEKVMEAGQVNVVDLRCANDKTFGFTMWEGYMAKYAQENPPGPGHYLVNIGDKRSEVVGAALIEIALPGHSVVR